MRQTLIVSAFVAVLAFVPASFAESLSAFQIMEKVDAVDDGDFSELDMEMVLIDKRGKQRKRMLHTFGKDAGENGKDSQSIMFFLSPADVKNTGFLSYDYDDPNKDDDQWLYLPALKKTKRIASSDKSSSFMGTDFTYADMSKRDISLYDYKLLKEDDVKGQKVWVIEAIATTEKELKETGYTKSVLFVRQDNFIVSRSVHWVKKGKKLKYMDVKNLEKIDGIWMATEIEMTLKKGKKTQHKTLLRMSNVKFNQSFADDLFSIRSLEKGLWVEGSQ